MNHCPKCDGPASREIREGVLEVDVAHAGETWEQAREKIVKALDQAIHYRHAGLKIVHGYGSTSGHSIIGPRATASCVIWPRSWEEGMRGTETIVGLRLFG